MDNATIYCMCLHNRVLPEIKKVDYVPVGLGNDNYSKEWLKDNTLETNITEDILSIIGFGKIFYQKLMTIIG